MRGCWGLSCRWGCRGGECSVESEVLDGAVVRACWGVRRRLGYRVGEDNPESKVWDGAVGRGKKEEGADKLDGSSLGS